MLLPAELPPKLNPPVFRRLFDSPVLDVSGALLALPPNVLEPNTEGEAAPKPPAFPKVGAAIGVVAIGVANDEIDDPPNGLFTAG